MRYCQYGCNNKEYYCYNKFRTMRASFLLIMDVIIVIINNNGDSFIQTLHCFSSFLLFCPYRTCKRTSHQKSHQEDGVKYRIFTLAQIRLPMLRKVTSVSAQLFLVSCVRIWTNCVEYHAIVRCHAGTMSTGTARKTSITPMPFAKSKPTWKSLCGLYILAFRL